MIHNVIKKNSYFDSVTLMLFSSKLNDVEGVEEAAVMMGTDHNIELMLSSNVLEKENIGDATSNDMIVGIRAKSQDAVDEALKVLEKQFENKNKDADKHEVTVKSVESAIKEKPELNFAVVSTPGRFAKKEVRKCLNNNLNVLLFSDNVDLEDEIELKNLALEKDLLMMGPDAGTAIVNGIALAFANVVKQGNIGLVGASGTGLQEIPILIDTFGGGVSQALGTGGRDVKDSVGGKMMLKSLDALNEDPNTKVIGIISKPPSPSVLEKILERAKTYEKPVVACFLGSDPSAFENTEIIATDTMEKAAQYLVNLSNDEDLKTIKPLTKDNLVKPLSKKNTGQYVRALYTGGTLAYEAMLLLKQSIGDVYSNIAIEDKLLLTDPEKSNMNTVVDMGEDYFTDGMAHPMIDPRLRNERIKQELNDTNTAVLLLDCVLGYGSHEDPAGEIAKAIEEGKKKQNGRDVALVASVTGTEKDEQKRSEQIEKLENAGVIVLPSNAQAAQYAALLLQSKGGQQ